MDVLVNAFRHCHVDCLRHQASTFSNNNFANDGDDKTALLG